MDILSSTSASGMEIDATIASKSRIPHWLEVQCETGSSPSCDAKRVDAVTVAGSHDVFIRYEAPNNGSNGVARVRVIKGDVHDPKDVLVQLRWTGELLTLDISATRKTVEVVLLQKDQLQRVVVEGSGDVVVEDNVLVTMGPSLSIAALGSGDIYATSTETIRVDTLTLTSKGSGLLQTSLSEIRVSKLLLQYYSSGDVALFSTAVGDVDKLSVIAEGSGDACLSWNSPVSVNQLEVEQVSSGDVSIGPQGSCQAAKLAMQGSGQLDVGGVLCDIVDVDLMSSGDVVVQVTDSLSVKTYGSGNVNFSGKPPSTITSTGYGRLYPTPVSSWYFPATCKRHNIPVIKPKYAAFSSGVLASASTGVELDSAESSSSSVADTNAVGIFWDGMNRDKDNLIPLAAFVFLVAMVLRWFNNSRRRAREEQRQPLLGAQRRVAINAPSTVGSMMSNHQLPQDTHAESAETMPSETLPPSPSSGTMDGTLSADEASYWTVHCTPGGGLCNEDQTFVVIVTGSYDVVLRYEDSGAIGSGDVARVSVPDSSSRNILTQTMVIDGLPVLEILAIKDDLEVVLLRKERVQRVVNQGSGQLNVQEDVVVSSGPSLKLFAIGSGDLYLTSSSPLTVDELSVGSQGSGQLQASFSEFDVKSLTMKGISSGDVTVLVGSKGTAKSFTLSLEGSGAMCLTSGSSLESDQLTIGKIGPGDVSLGPRGSCHNADISTGASGTIDAGGIQCQNVDVDLLGSTDIVVQATGALTGDNYGSGHLKYYGAAPHSIDNVNYMGLVTAGPVSSSYQPTGCKAGAFSHIKPTDAIPSSSGIASKSAGEEFRYDVNVDQSNVLYLAGIVFFVALVLRQFNDSRRQAREEQRQPLVGAARREYV